MEDCHLIYLYWLIRLFSPGNPKLYRLIDHYGSAENVYFSTKDQLMMSGILDPSELRRVCEDRDVRSAAFTLERLEREGIRTVTIWDSEYPSLLREIDPPPLLLFYKGEPNWINPPLTIAVCGTRRMTKYGAEAVRRIVGDLADIGCLIVGGLSDGIDSTAHQETLMHGGQTLAVMPGGVDVVYPRSEYNLYWDIADHGCVISEFLPGDRPLGSHFQLRNRVIAGLSNGVLHIQSPEKSGSLITVKWAVQYNRDVFALPGDVGIQQSEGPNQLIQSGAKLVTGAMDILDEYGYLFADAIARMKKRAQAEPPKKPMGEKDKAITELLKNGDQDVTYLAMKSGIPLAELILLLTDLQIKGIICEKPGGFYSLSKSFTL